MGRALLVLDSPADRQKAVTWIGKAPVGTRVEFKASKRSLPQNDLMWALLTDFSQQFAMNDRKYDPSQWKAIFLHAFGREISFLPSLDGKTFLPIEMSSSDLSKEEMTDFIEFIIKEAAERGVVLHNPKEQDSDSSTAPSGEVGTSGDERPLSSAAPDDDTPPLPSSSGASLSQADLDWLATVAKMLWSATNEKGDREEAVRLLETQKMCVPSGKGMSENARAIARKIYDTLEMTAKFGFPKEEKRKVIANYAGINEKELVNG